MPKNASRFAVLGQSGMTLMEVMISTGLAGLVMVALMTLLYQSSRFSGRMSGEFESVEGVADAVALLNNVVGQTTRIQSCKCRGNTSSRALCVFDSSSPWYDPVLDGSGTSPLTILQGEYEAFDGTQSLTSMAALTTSSISIPGQTCASASSSLTSANMRGCKLSYSLVYTAPTADINSNLTTSGGNAGSLKIAMGTGKSAFIGPSSSYTTAQKQRGANGLGVTELACGFESGLGGVTGSNFVLNIKLKARSNMITTPTNFNYESWYRTSTKYVNGMFKPIQLKFALRNLTSRGVYFWKPDGFKGCKSPGATASSAAQCCSQAWNGSTCATCIASGYAGTSNASCCSGQLSGGNCL